MGINSISELETHLLEIKHIALDMDGTIYNGNTLFQFTLPFLAKMKELGIRYSFLTNNPTKSIDSYLEHLANMGILATREEMYSSAQATIDYLKKNFPEIKRLFILGTPSMISEFEKAGFISTNDDPDDIPQAVIVSFDTSLTYSRLCRAAWWVKQQLPYIATNPDKVCPTDMPVTLVDCGSICSSLEQATGRTPDIVIGKPDPRMLEGIQQRYQLQPSQIAIIGDRIYTDLQMAYNAKALGVLVLTGETSIKVAEQSVPRPDIIVDNLGDFGEMLYKLYSDRLVQK
ncbi:HAD-IIA family hydrolase [uncultured Bacteroides sp.]|uniref:HAD-IIA family hydrolase n=1 Tax=uncultured Bacteroides sp. TaxID=162156 RepID=UPI002AABF55E|nr:HAD-IIA family hydrolase [uncultured Bacteroides sp.]